MTKTSKTGKTLKFTARARRLVTGLSRRGLSSGKARPHFLRRAALWMASLFALIHKQNRTRT